MHTQTDKHMYILIYSN